MGVIVQAIALFFIWISGALGTNNRIQALNKYDTGSCSDEFGSPRGEDCALALRQIPKSGRFPESIKFYGKAYSLDGYLQDGVENGRSGKDVFLPLYYKAGTCAISLYLPNSYWDLATWEEIHLGVSSLVYSCTYPPVNTGGFKYIGRLTNIQAIVYRAPDEMGNDNHEIRVKATTLADIMGMSRPGFKSSKYHARFDEPEYVDQMPITGRRCRPRLYSDKPYWDVCTGHDDCALGCKCVAMKRASLSSIQNGYVAMCAQLISGSGSLVGIGGR